MARTNALNPLAEAFFMPVPTSTPITKSTTAEFTNNNRNVNGVDPQSPASPYETTCENTTTTTSVSSTSQPTTRPKYASNAGPVITQTANSASSSSIQEAYNNGLTTMITKTPARDSNPELAATQRDIHSQQLMVLHLILEEQILKDELMILRAITHGEEVTISAECIERVREYSANGEDLVAEWESWCTMDWEDFLDTYYGRAARAARLQDISKNRKISEPVDKQAESEEEDIIL